MSNVPWDIKLPRPYCKYVLDSGSVLREKNLTQDQDKLERTVRLIEKALNSKNLIDHVYPEINMTAACFKIDSYVDKDEWVISCNTPENRRYRISYKDNYITTEFYYAK